MENARKSAKARLSNTLKYIRDGNEIHHNPVSCLANEYVQQGARALRTIEGIMSQK